MAEIPQYCVEQVKSVSDELVNATARLVAELDSSNQMAVTVENLERVASAPDQVWLAARESDEFQIVGMVILITSPVLTNIRAELLNLVVDPNHRKQGVAKLLVERSLEEAEVRKVNTIHLETGPNNDPGNALFQKLGAVPCMLSGYNFFLQGGPRL